MNISITIAVPGNANPVTYTSNAVACPGNPAPGPGSKRNARRKRQRARQLEESAATANESEVEDRAAKRMKVDTAHEIDMEATRAVEADQVHGIDGVMKGHGVMEGHGDVDIGQKGKADVEAVESFDIGARVSAAVFVGTPIDRLRLVFEILEAEAKDGLPGRDDSNIEFCLKYLVYSAALDPSLPTRHLLLELLNHPVVRQNPVVRFVGFAKWLRANY